ncbi:MAG: hypothetical protein JWN70_1017 [Planctomycetaceae bacterium]|nr:hypothetical protein [Planctomycetaceae bacterium]
MGLRLAQCCQFSPKHRRRAFRLTTSLCLVASTDEHFLLHPSPNRSLLRDRSLPAKESAQNPAFNAVSRIMPTFRCELKNQRERFACERIYSLSMKSVNHSELFPMGHHFGSQWLTKQRVSLAPELISTGNSGCLGNCGYRGGIPRNSLRGARTQPVGNSRGSNDVASLSPELLRGKHPLLSRESLNQPISRP